MLDIFLCCTSTAFILARMDGGGKRGGEMAATSRTANWSSTKFLLELSSTTNTFRLSTSIYVRHCECNFDAFLSTSVHSLEFGFLVFSREGYRD